MLCRPARDHRNVKIKIPTTNKSANPMMHPNADSDLFVAPIGLPIDLSICLLALYALPHTAAPMLVVIGSLFSCPGVLLRILDRTRSALDTLAE